MTTAMATAEKMAPGAVALKGAALAGVALIVAGAVQGDGGIVTAAYLGDSPVDEDLVRFPWHRTTAATLSITWGLTQLMITAALVAFARSEAVGSSRRGRVGAWLTVVGGVLFSLGHATSLASLDAAMDDGPGTMVMALFGLGTVLNAVGFVLAGIATAKSGWWSGWHRFTPLAIGITTIALIPLQFTPLLAVTVAIYSTTIIALGVAMLLESQSGSAAARS